MATDRERFATALFAASELYGKRLGQGAVDLYWRVLSTYPIADVLAGFERHLADPDAGQFMPKPADIVRQIDGSGDSQAMLAWTRALTAVRRVGTYQTVVFDDWRIHAVVSDMGGWIALGMIDADDLPFRAAEFVKRYRGYRAEASYPRKLVGRLEAENSAAGHASAVPVPVLIGDQQQAMLVHQRGDDRKVLQVGMMPVADLEFFPRLSQDDAA